MNGSQPLAGLKILNTRQVEFAKPLTQAMKKLGAIVVSIPLLRIEASAAINPLQHLIDKMHEVECIVCLSKNTVNVLKNMLEKNSVWLNQKQWYAVGPSTANSLKKVGISNIRVPKQANSDGLLALLSQQTLHTKTCLVLHGRHTQAEKFQVLQQSAMHVLFQEVYVQTENPAAISQCRASFNHTAPDIIVISSGYILQQLDNMLKLERLGSFNEAWLLVVSPRLEQQARKLGFDRCLLAASAQVQSIIECLVLERCQ